MHETIVTDRELNPAEQALLARACAAMLPADPVFGVPGAHDPLILAEVTAILLRSPEPARAALAALASAGPAPFEGSSEFELLERIEAFRAASPREAALLIGAVLEAYYRDDRVMRSLGMDVRSPFPGGYDVPEGDWALLDPVRARGPFWRKVPD